MSLTLLLLLACTDDKDTGHTHSDTGHSHDSGDGDSGHSHETGDSGGDSAGPGGTELTFEWSGDATGATLVLTRMFDPYNPIFAELLVSEAVTESPMVVLVPDPPEWNLAEDGDHGENHLHYGEYAVSLHLDDGDGVPETGETFVGLATRVLLYYTGGDPPDDYNEGWNAYGLGEEGTVPMLDTAPLEAVPVERLSGADAVALSGTWGGEVAGDGIAAVSASGEVLADGPLGAAWTLAPAPPVSTDAIEAAGDVTGAVAALQVYQDSDGSGGYSAGDVVSGVVCTPEGQGVALVWVDTPLSMKAAWSLIPWSAGGAAWPLQPGWNVQVAEASGWVGPGEAVDDAALEGLVVCDVTS